MNREQENSPPIEDDRFNKFLEKIKLFSGVAISKDEAIKNKKQRYLTVLKFPNRNGFGLYMRDVTTGEYRNALPIIMNASRLQTVTQMKIYLSGVCQAFAAVTPSSR